MKYLLLDNLFYTLEMKQLDRHVFVNNSFIQGGKLPELFNQYFQEMLSLDTQKALAIMYGNQSLQIVDDLLKPMAQMNITFGNPYFNNIKIY